MATKRVHCELITAVLLSYLPSHATCGLCQPRLRVWSLVNVLNADCISIIVWKRKNLWRVARIIIVPILEYMLLKHMSGYSGSFL